MLNEKIKINKFVPDVLHCVRIKLKKNCKKVVGRETSKEHFLYRRNKNLFSRQFNKILKVNFNFHCRDDCHLHLASFFVPWCLMLMLCVSLESAEIGVDEKDVGGKKLQEYWK